MTFDLSEAKEIVKASFEAFLEHKQYAYSYRQACREFGKVNIDTLVANGFLENRSEMMGYKRFLLTDIIAAMAAWDKR